MRSKCLEYLEDHVFGGVWGGELWRGRSTIVASQPIPDHLQGGLQSTEYFVKGIGIKVIGKVRCGTDKTRTLK
jgi:hypothetical protein